MSSKISFEVGNGQRVKFWKGKWCGIDSLWDFFLSLFSLTCSKDAWVEDVWDFSIPREGGWSPSFSRPLNDWEVGSAELFLSCLDGMMVNSDRKIRCVRQRLRARLVVIFKSVSTLKNTFKCFWDENKVFGKF